MNNTVTTLSPKNILSKVTIKNESSKHFDNIDIKSNILYVHFTDPIMWDKCIYTASIDKKINIGSIVRIFINKDMSVTIDYKDNSGNIKYERIETQEQLNINHIEDNLNSDSSKSAEDQEKITEDEQPLIPVESRIEETDESGDERVQLENFFDKITGASIWDDF
ncbi:MAG: hypothetical protein AB1629_08530 [Candidatus Omnitrophota bacterium]